MDNLRAITDSGGPSCLEARWLSKRDAVAIGWPEEKGDHYWVVVAVEAGTRVYVVSRTSQSHWLDREKIDQDRVVKLDGLDYAGSDMLVFGAQPYWVYVDAWEGHFVRQARDADVPRKCCKSIRRAIWLCGRNWRHVRRLWDEGGCAACSS